MTSHQDIAIFCFLLEAIMIYFIYVFTTTTLRQASPNEYGGGGNATHACRHVTLIACVFFIVGMVHTLFGGPKLTLLIILMYNKTNNNYLWRLSG